MIRIGNGFDVHKFVPNRELILGGVTIPCEYGLLGHSDADVLTHAVMDSLLGALALGDIGCWFPDTELKYKGADSCSLLKYILASDSFLNKWKVVNLDSTIIAQVPKIAPYIERIRINFSNILQCSIDQISVKATTTEGLGFCGRKEGIAAQAVVLLESIL